MNKRIGLLTSMPVFGGLSPATMELITAGAEPVTVPPGGHFFREGEKSQTMYVLESGRVEIYKTWHGTSKLLRTMGPGDCFGEMAIIDLFPRSASALAVHACEALQITPSILQDVYRHDMEQFALLQMNMSREVSRRLRDVLELLFRTQMGEPLAETTVTYFS